AEAPAGAAPMRMAAAPAARGQAPERLAAGEQAPGRQVRTGAPREYMVRKGDFPELIAKRFGVSPETVLFHNKLTKRSILQVGQKLEIPPASGYYHTVRRGETLKGLLAGRDLDEARFRRYNPGVGDRLRAKQTVFIPGKPPVVAEERRRPERPERGYRERDTRKKAHRGVFGDLGRAISDGFHWPLSTKAVSSGFGERGRRDWHPGIDIRAGVGTPIRAARDGVVVRAGWEGAYGRMVEISHGGGVSTRYAHASSLAVSPGERVEAGEIIGRVGTTGRSTGPHLHYEVRINGRPVNPKRVH
ncbi:MAG: peptidoglycan DD-metalloendopeptidase family protein, partial [Candidatus Sericytochromatia bacterium]|nr:peptidoglycan DD-metalloendopeptidase family protein [Candidatus Tanganyikabacteria bacterium]